MRTSISVFLAGLVLVVTTTACSSGNARPATVRNYGPEASSTYARQPAPPAAYQPAPAQPSYAGASAGGYQWFNRLTEAQAAARASGKLILAMSTKPGCGLCDKFKTETLPQASGQAARISVGYIYNILSPEAPQVDRALRANLRGADLMPLVGFLTPDLRWVHGFYGARSVAQFQGDIAQAQRIYPVSAGVIRTVPQGPTTATASAPVVNEYGEPEWSPAGDVWPGEDPEPIDAITGEPGLTPESQAGAMLADAPPAPAPLPTVTQPAAPMQPLAVAPPPPPAPGATYVGIRPPMPTQFPAPVAAAPIPAARAPALVPAAPAPAPRAATPVASAPQPAGDLSWGDRLLRRALEEIRIGRYDAARATLAEVRTRAPEESTESREASKGCVALYNARRIQGAASGAERTRYLSRARRDLGASMWGVLFES